MEKLRGETIVLTPAEKALFKAKSLEPMMAEIQAGEVMVNLAARQQNILVLAAVPTMVSWVLYFESNAFNKRLETFLPVAGAILAHELGSFVNRKPHGDTCEL